MTEEKKNLIRECFESNIEYLVNIPKRDMDTILSVLHIQHVHTERRLKELSYLKNVVVMDYFKEKYFNPKVSYEETWSKYMPLQCEVLSAIEYKMTEIGRKIFGESFNCITYSEY